MNNDIEMVDYSVRNSAIGNKHKDDSRKVSRVELRVKNDIAEFKNKRTTTGNYEVKLSTYFISENGMTCSLNVEFKNYFEICIVFKKEYPFEPPEVVYISGKEMDMFDMEMRLKLPLLKKEIWKPILSLNSILFSIELLLINKENFVEEDKEFEMEIVNKKRKMKEYLMLNNTLMNINDYYEITENDNSNMNGQYIVFQMGKLKMKNDGIYKH